MHRRLIIGLALTASLLLRVPAALAADPAPEPANPGTKRASDEIKVAMDEEAKKAAQKALEWLAARQNADGSWSASANDSGSYPHNTAITAFVLLSFMSQGNVPGQGQFAPEVRRGADFLIASQRDDGYIVGKAGGNMYCHGMATLALAELWGMTGDEKVREALKKAVDLIVGCQCRRPGAEGGWRYQPQNTDSDISVTIMQVMALRAAKNGGIHVPDETLNQAIKYVMKCYDKQKGGFAYTPGSGPGFARTAAGVCVLQLTMKYEKKNADAAPVDKPAEIKETEAREKEEKVKAIDAGIKYLREHKEDGHFWYGNYYAAHAMHQYGGPQDKYWADWYKQKRDALMSDGERSPDGSWTAKNRDGVGPVYQTAIAVIILSVPQNYLPIFQK